MGPELPLVDTVLTVERLTLSFAGLVAIDGLSFSLRAGELLGIIGPNGAGKTSVLNCINGFYHPQSGRIHLGGREITHQPPHVRARLGIGRTFQNIALYPAMSALANIMSGRLIHMRSGVLAGGLYWGPAEREFLRHRARAEEKADMARYILELREVRGLPMILIEHDMGVIMDLCDRLICMDYGKKIAEGPPQEIQHHADVIRAYLGEDHAVVGGGGRGGGEEA